MEDSVEKRWNEIRRKEKIQEEEETKKRANAFCQPERKTSTESFIESIEQMDSNERLTKLESLSKSDLKRIAETLGKGIKSDTHTLNRLIVNRYCYKEISRM